MGNFELEDSNGNIAAPSLDSLGRTFYSTNLPIGGAGPIPAGTYTVTTYSASGAAQVYTITVSTETIGSYSMPHPSNNDFSGMPNCWWQINCPTSTGANTPGGSISAITKIQLPNGQSYQFTYDPAYATISRSSSRLADMCALSGEFAA